MMREHLIRVLAPVAVAIVLLAAWQLAVMFYEVPSYLVPSPLRIAQTMIEDRDLLLGSLWVTAEIALTALAIAVLAGVATALLFAQSRIIEASLLPYAILLQVTPIVAIAPLIIIWVKDTHVALVLCAVVVAIFPIISSTSVGLRSIDPGLADLFRMSRATRLQTLVRLRIPSALPYFFAGLRVASGLALIGAVVAEFVAGTGGQGAGLAYQILMAGIQLNVPRLFAALVLITLAGIVLYLAVGLLAHGGVGGLNIGAPDGRLTVHHERAVGSRLERDVLAVHRGGRTHLGQLGAGKFLTGDDVQCQDRRQQVGVGEDGVEVGRRDGGEGVVGRGEDRERTIAVQRVDQSGGVDGGRRRLLLDLPAAGDGQRLQHGGQDFRDPGHRFAIEGDEIAISG